MPHANPFASREPFKPSQHEVKMLDHMVTELSIKSPYRKYGSYGVPCPEGVSTFQLNIRREQWYNMLEGLAWREHVMLEEVWAHAQQEAHQGLNEELSRKDSLNADEIVAQKESEGDTSGRSYDNSSSSKSMPGLAIHDSSEDEMRAERAEEAKQQKGAGEMKGKAHKMHRTCSVHSMRSFVTGATIGSGSGHTSRRSISSNRSDGKVSTE